jgi:hypothetical protein
MGIPEYEATAKIREECDDELKKKRVWFRDKRSNIIMITVHKSKGENTLFNLEHTGLRYDVPAGVKISIMAPSGLMFCPVFRMMTLVTAYS